VDLSMAMLNNQRVPFSQFLSAELTVDG
jgi:hypothetical protein